jgi:hypothetical protein
VSPQQNVHDGTGAIRLALFASALSVLLTAAMLLLRTGLPTPLGAVVLGPAITGISTLGPALWANRHGFRAQIWLGPIAALVLIVGCLMAAFGIVGQALIWIAFLAALARSVIVLRAPSAIPGGRLSLWLLLLLAAGLLATIMIGGSKYVNFIADQLLLYGRTDGDVMFHGAIANAMRYFGFPSTGIDGLQLLRYHWAGDALTAMIAAGNGIDAVMALVILQAGVLVPLSVFAIGWAAGAFGAHLLPELVLRPLGLATGAVIMALLMQSGSIGNLVFANTPMLLSGVLLVLLAPAVVFDLIERRERAFLALVVAIIALPVLSMTKISTGLIWGALVGYLVLRQIGPKRLGFWLVGFVMLALFAGCFWLGNDPARAGAKLFGVPFFVQGFIDGNYLMPLTVHLYLLVVLVTLLRLRDAAPPPRRRLLIETLLFVTLIANLPGLVLEIAGSDFFFFLSAMNWLFAPLVATLIAALPDGLRRAQPRGRRITVGLVAVALIAALVDGGLKADDKFFTAISGAALVHTGDLAYYADDRRRVWRADTKRALAEYGLIGLYRLIPPEPAGAELAEALAEAKQSDPRASAYIPPQSDYWTFVNDCDGRSVWPMAVAGVPLIDGTVPVQAECKQEFALIGYGTPPETRTPLAEPELCRRAIEDGLPAVLQIESLHDRGKDKLTACR